MDPFSLGRGNNMDPFSLVGVGAGLISSFIGSDAAKKQEQAQAIAMKRQMQAQQQAEALSAAMQTQKEQYTTLWLVGGIGAVLALALISAAAWKKRG